MPIFLMAITVEIKKDSTVEVKPSEINVMKKIWKRKGVAIEYDDAKKLILENRLLSNDFIKKYGIDSDYLMRLRLQAEEDLSKLLIKKTLDEHKVDDRVLKSYYIDKYKEFISDKKVHFKAFGFEDFDSAYNFYKKYKNNIENINKLNIYAKENNITIVDKTLSENNINPQISPLFKKSKEPVLLPPVFYGNKFYEIAILERIPAKKIPFEKAKNIIKEKLFAKRYNEIRNKLLKKHENNEDE